MKRLIILKVEYPGGPKNRDEAYKQFTNAVGLWGLKPPFKILKRLEPKPEVIVEFPDDQYQDVYDKLRELDIVETIDSILPPSET